MFPCVQLVVENGMERYGDRDADVHAVSCGDDPGGSGNAAAANVIIVSSDTLNKTALPRPRVPLRFHTANDTPCCQRANSTPHGT